MGPGRSWRRVRGTTCSGPTLWVPWEPTQCAAPRQLIHGWPMAQGPRKYTLERLAGGKYSPSLVILPDGPRILGLDYESLPRVLGVTLLVICTDFYRFLLVI